MTSRIKSRRWGDAEGKTVVSQNKLEKSAHTEIFDEKSTIYRCNQKQRILHNISHAQKKRWIFGFVHREGKRQKGERKR